MPERLLDALWLQAAEAICSQRIFRACRSCGRWLEIALGAMRPNTLFCSAACRNRHYRARQEQARQMAAAGKSISEIAQELATEVDVIHNWVSGMEG
jgi:hypothetical protein